MTHLQVSHHQTPDLLKQISIRWVTNIFVEVWSIERLSRRLIDTGLFGKWPRFILLDPTEFSERCNL